MSVAWITLNRACNINCSYCYLKSFKKKNNELKIKDALRLINHLKVKEYEKIFLIGGEPTLYKNLLEVITYISSKEMKPFLLTNGIDLAKPELVRKLKNAGLSSLNISFKTELWNHNKMKYKKVLIQSLSLLKDYNMNYLISFVVTQNNLTYILNSILFLKELGIKYFYFVFENETDNNDEDLNEVFLFLENFAKKYSKIKELCPEFLIHSIYPICFYPVEFRKIIMSEKRFRFFCQVHDKKSVTFDTNMDILFCNQNYKTKLLKYKDTNSLLEFQKTTFALPFSICKKCKYRKICGGGCPLKWNNYHSKGITFIQA